MFNSIFETVVRGSNVIFLVLSEEDYFLSYESLSLDSTQELVDNYFKFRGRDGAPRVTDVDLDKSTHKVKIMVKVDYEKEHEMEPMSITEFTNTTTGGRSV